MTIDDEDLVEEEDSIEEYEEVDECEICGTPCSFIPFPCRDDDGNLAEIRGCCQKCHDIWCLCNCSIQPKENKE